MEDGLRTIDELSSETGVSITTLRLYHRKRLLPPPLRRGRVGLYDDAHVARLGLIARLQDRGYSLAAIGDVVSRGATVDDLLSSASLGVEEPVRLTLPDLLRRLPAPDFTFELARRAEALGLVRIDGEMIVVDSPTFLEVGGALIALGVPAQMVLDQYEGLRSRMQELAGSFASVFDSSLRARAESAPMDEVERLLKQLSDLAAQVVVVELRRALRSEVAQRIETELGMSGPGPA